MVCIIKNTYTLVAFVHKRQKYNFSGFLISYRRQILFEGVVITVQALGGAGLSTTGRGVVGLVTADAHAQVACLVFTFVFLASVWYLDIITVKQIVMSTRTLFTVLINNTFARID